MNVWDLTATASLGAGSTFHGNILATGTVTVGESGIVLDSIRAGAAVTVGGGAMTADVAAGATVTVGAGAHTGHVTTGAIFFSGAKAVIRFIDAKGAFSPRRRYRGHRQRHDHNAPVTVSAGASFSSGP